MKTTKYTIDFGGTPTLFCEEMAISKNEFERQLKGLKSRLLIECREDFEVGYSEYTRETESLIITTHHFNSSFAVILLNEYKCKKGYCFTKGI